MSSIPQNKHELLAAIQTAYTKITIDYTSIPAEHTRTYGVDGNSKGTQITVCDTLAYLIGWEKLVLKWYKNKKEGKSVDFPEKGYKWNQLGLLAQHFYTQYQDASYPALLNEFEQVTAAIIELIESLSEQELYGTAWYKKYTLGKMVQYNTASPMKNMRTKIRKFKRTNGL
ncbi:ClbS/DfsB family four-helix bundle protein [Halodesulfovibrio sp.]|jgi:hypothetical protein|uniref:ClbS/DfsB family four-helix bundle protein n=1 Tax=Halodesulfovibrio sp. TaxID=1912772 RepID=UPI0025F706ED|nr:ClbS/DfsB family four-helix bundle protein [Halodesulfovibrio sp.]MCT4534702.1 ClbS/DfsB family four-helix bundle protein [Halodesulfovibrio sp.]